MAGSDLLQLGLGLFALVAGLGAAAGKVAALGGVDGAGHVAGNDDPLLLGLLAGVRDGHRRKQRLQTTAAHILDKDFWKFDCGQNVTYRSLH